MEPVYYCNLVGDGNLLDSHPTRQDLGYLIIRDSYKYQYCILTPDCLVRLASEPNYYHEVIDLYMKYRMYFDVETEVRYLPERNLQEEDEVKEFMISAIERAFAEINQWDYRQGAPKFVFNRCRLTILNASRRQGDLIYKISMHFILCDVILEGPKLANRIAIVVNKYTPYQVDKVYTNFHGMRIINSIKDNSMLSFDKTHDGPKSIAESLITNVQKRHTMTYDVDDDDDLSYPADSQQINKTLSEYDISEIIALLNQKVGLDPMFFVIDRTCSGFYKLIRKQSSMCMICDRVHDSENMFIRVFENGKTRSVILGCFRDPTHILGPFELKNKVQNAIYAISNHISHILGKYDERSAEDINQINYKNASQGSSFTDWFSKDVVPAKIISYRAPTGSGKTHNLCELVGKQIQWNFIIITYRRTLSNQMNSRLADFDPVLYNEIKGKLFGRVLIVQIDSLVRIDIEKYKNVPVVIVCDEIDGIFMHYSTMSNLRRLIVAKMFYKLCNMAIHIIILDAYLRNVHLRPFSEIITQNIVRIVNFKESEKHIEYSIYITQATLLNELMCESPESTIVIVCSTLRDARGIKQMLMDISNISEDNICSYTSDTSSKTIRDDFADINKALIGKKRIIYTPTIMAGIDITFPVDVLYAFMDVKMHHLTAPSAMQMIKRCRNCDEYKIFINAQNSYIKSCLYGDFMNMSKQRIIWQISRMHDTAADISFSPATEFMYAIESAAQEVASASESAFIDEIILCMLSYGASVYVKSESEYEKDDDMDSQLKMACELCEIEIASKIYEIRNTPEHLLTDEDEVYFRILNKYRKIYNIDDELLTEEFILYYYKDSRLRVFKNFRRLMSFSIPDNNKDSTFDLYIMLGLTESSTPIMISDGSIQGQIIAIMLMIVAFGYLSIFDCRPPSYNLDITQLSDAIMMFYASSCAAGRIKRYKKNVIHNKDKIVNTAKRLLKTYGINVHGLNKPLKYSQDFTFFLSDAPDIDIYNLFEMVKSQLSAVNNKTNIIPYVLINSKLFSEILINPDTHYNEFIDYMQNKASTLISSVCSF